VIVVLVAAVAGYFELAQPLLQGDAPAAAVRQMCADEMRHDYEAVYRLLASSFIHQFQLDADTFVQSQLARDQGFGPVVACAVGGRDYRASLWNAGAALLVTATLSDDHFTQTATGTIWLVHEGGWKISDESLDAILFFAG
jgi:hypothetical protein